MVSMLCPRNSRAEFEFRELGARAAALAGAYSALATDAYAPFWNPGALGALDHREAAALHVRNYSVRELSSSGISVAAPSKLGGLAMSITQFGSHVYREQELSLSHGFKIFKSLSAGYSLRGNFLKIEDFGASSSFSADVGIHAAVTDRLDLAQTGMNITRSRRSAIWTSGLAFKVMPGLTLAFDLEGVGAPVQRLKTGMELQLAPSFSALGGLQTDPSRFSGGFRLRHGTISLDYAYRHHAFLPGSHHVGVQYSWAGLLQPEQESIALPPQESKINLQTANEDDLMKVKGVGRFTAQKIIEYRSQQGFKTIDDLLQVPGMTKRVFFLLKGQCILNAVIP